MMKRILAIVIGCVALTCASLSAQTVSGSQDYTSGFSAIEVSDYFSATVVHDDYYGAEWNIEDDLREAMHIYVRGDVLVVSVDRKALSAEAKKKYTGKKNATAVMSVKIHTPGFKTLVAKENASVNLESYKVDTDEVILELDDNASVKGLDVIANAVTVTASKKARMELATVNADNISINTNNSAFVRIEQKSKNCSLQLTGNADLYVIGDCETLTVNSANSSKLRLEGNAVTLNLTASGKEIHAEGLNVNDAVVFGSNACKADINVSENLSLELKGGCHINYAGKPVIDIVGIQNSSVGHINF